MGEYFHQFSFQGKVFSAELCSKKDELYYKECVLSVPLSRQCFISTTIPRNAFSKDNFFKKIVSKELFRRECVISGTLKEGQVVLNKTLCSQENSFPRVAFSFTMQVFSAETLPRQSIIYRIFLRLKRFHWKSLARNVFFSTEYVKAFFF